MTPEQRLTQIEKILENSIKLGNRSSARIDRNAEAIERLTEKTDRNAEAIDRLTEKTDRNAEAIDRLTDRIDNLTSQMDRAMEIFIDSMGVMRVMQSEIKGIQLENRRIIERFFGEETEE